MLLINLFSLWTQGLYPNPHTNVAVSSGEDNAPKPDASAGKEKAPAGDDAENGAVTSAEPITPNLIRPDVLEHVNSFVVDQPNSVVPPGGGRGCKCPPSMLRQKQPLPSIDHVMTQIELPPFHGPHSPLDLVAIEIIFGCLFEAFQHTSKANDAGTSAGDDTRPQMKPRQQRLRNVLVPRYSAILFVLF
jgi:hypothetical protein